MSLPNLWMTAGFLVAAYSVVANDAIQTLGTFLSSNARRPWWVLWLFASGILVTVMLIGWATHGGDASYGRLSAIPYPEHASWVFVVPPVVVLILTRFAVPVSTTVLILTAFSPAALGPILAKSLLGYAVALVVGALVYKGVARLEKRFLEDRSEPGKHWVALQWLSTGFLWSQWLMQDFANVFAYLPRALSWVEVGGALVVMLVLHAVLFARRGGEIQKVVTSKTNTQDIRSATVIDFLYALILLFFKELSHIPMSTTWVFLGLLAGRELALTHSLRVRTKKETGWLIAKDASKAVLGLAISVVLGLVLPLFR